MANPTQYHRPTSLDIAAALLRDHPEGLAIAGGGLTFSDALLPYPTVIDLQAIPEMNVFDYTEHGVLMGGSVMLSRLLEFPNLPDAIRRALTRALPPNVRNNVSVGESLRQRHHPMLWEWIAAAYAHDIGVEILDPATGERGWNDLIALIESGEIDTGIITAVDLPALAGDPPQALGSAHVARTPTGEPIVNAAAFVILDDERRVESVFTALCGVSDQPLVSVGLPTLLGNPLDTANITSAVKSVALQLDPPGDYKGSSEYRREMARVCMQRALVSCLEQLAVKA